MSSCVSCNLHPGFGADTIELTFMRFISADPAHSGADIVGAELKSVVHSPGASCQLVCTEIDTDLSIRSQLVLPGPLCNILRRSELSTTW